MPDPQSDPQPGTDPVVAAQQQPGTATDAVTQALAVALGSGVSFAVLAAAVVPLLTGLGVSATAAKAALALTLSAPMPTGAPSASLGFAQGQVRASVPTYRAAYLLSAARRIQAALHTHTLADAVAAEKRYFAAHLAAQANRKAAAKAVDAAATAHGPLLGWYAVMDTRTSAECAAANGHNFTVTQRPAIGWPGSVHPHCRCVPGPAHMAAGTVDQAVGPLLRRAA